MAQKLEFEGQSINISSRNLALGVLTLNTSTFNGTSFSAFLPPNSTDPKVRRWTVHLETFFTLLLSPLDIFLSSFVSAQIGFELTANPLAQVTLPGSLLSGVSLSEGDRASLSRINFMFFSSTNLFQVRRSNSASSELPAVSSVLIGSSVGLQKEQGSLALNSYVVASSVGNMSIRDLKDPVKIQIAHLQEQVPRF